MTLWQDLRYAARLLIKDRWFTAVAATALALGIGVNTTVFTLVNAVLLRGLPFDQPDRIVSIAGTDARGRPTGVSRLDFLDWSENNRAFAGLTLIVSTSLNVSDPEEGGRPPEQFQGTYNSANTVPADRPAAGPGPRFQRRGRSGRAPRRP